MIDVFPPALILFFGAAFITFTRGRVQNAVVLLMPLLALWFVWQVPNGVSMSLSFMNHTLELVEGSKIRRLFATIFTLMMFVGGLYAYRHASKIELASAFAYAGGAVGVAFSGDLLSLFVFWEIMAIFSTLVVWCGGTDEARAAGLRYAYMHFLGGVILMVGIAGVAVQSGSIDIQAMRANSIATWLVMIGVLINAAAPPVSAWLADAYPEATATGTVFLSAFTTKAAVLALILLFPGEPVLIGVGIYMIFYGIIYALLENDARRILAYSIVNQVGFMVCAVGIGTELALNGAAAHAFAHIVYKGLLFMCAGVVLYRTGMRKCTDLGGLFRTMPITCLCGIIGALSISSFPLTSGFVTKALISEAAKNEGLVFVYFCLAAASAGVFLHAGIKFPWFVFFQKDSGLRPKDAPWNMSLAMVLFSLVCLGLGMYPQAIYQLLPYEVNYTPYSFGKVLYYLQLLLFSGLAFFLLLPLMKRTLTITLDFDWFWRRCMPAFGKLLLFVLAAADKSLQTIKTTSFKNISQFSARHLSANGVFGRSWAIGIATLWIAVLISGYVLFYYI